MHGLKLASEAYYIVIASVVGPLIISPCTEACLIKRLLEAIEQYFFANKTSSF